MVSERQPPQGLNVVLVESVMVGLVRDSDGGSGVTVVKILCGWI